MSYPLSVIMLSTDASAFDEQSELRQRLVKYAEQFESLRVLVIGARASRAQVSSLIIEPVPVLFKLRIPWATKNAVRRALAAQPTHIVSAQDPFETGLGAWWGIKGTQTKLHIQVHTDFLNPAFSAESWKNRLRVRIADRVLPHASGIRVVSQRIKQSLVARYGSHIPEPAVIPVAVRVIDAPAVPLPQHPFSFALVTMSRLAKEKRIEQVIYALARIRMAYPGTGLFIIGDGKEKKRLLALTKELGIADAVQWLGWRTDGRQLLKSANAFIQASSYEGYSMSIVEAALARVPIITTDVGLVGEVLRPDKDVLVASAETESLAAQIARLIEDNQLRKAMALEAEHTIQEHLALNANQPERIAENIAQAAGTPA